MEICEIEIGETRTVEFKKELPQDSSKWIKTIVAFANGAGGKLLIGVSNKREIIGIPQDTDIFALRDKISDTMFLEIGDLLRVNFYRPSYSNIKQNDPINDPINLFDLIKQNPSGSYEDYAQKLNVSSATIKRKIAELKAEGKIVRKGSNKNVFWETES